jgi:hypothetical protein
MPAHACAADPTPAPTPSDPSLELAPLAQRAPVEDLTPLSLGMGSLVVDEEPAAEKVWASGATMASRTCCPSPSWIL